MVEAIILVLDFDAIIILKIYVCLWSDQKLNFVLWHN